MQYEYNELHHSRATIGMLNQLGLDGWELVLFKEDTWMYIFKRIKNK